MKKNLAGNEKGFTLIELIVVIVLLGVLAAVAVPKYMDLTNEAYKASADGVFSAARGAATLNFAKNLAGGAVTPVTLLQSGADRLKELIDVSNEYTLTASAGNLAVAIGGKTYNITISEAETTAGAAPKAAVLAKGTWPAP